MNNTKKKKVKLKLTKNQYLQIAKNIRKYRIENDLTQEELANKILITGVSMSLKENGISDLTLPEALKIAKLFNTTLDNIFLV